MNARKYRTRRLPAAFAGLLLAGALAAHAQEYNITGLGALGGTGSWAKAINNHGQVVGYARDVQGRAQAFVWQHGHMKGLGFLPGGSASSAQGINHAGQITGYSYLSATQYHAFLWETNHMADLGTLGGPNSAGRFISEGGCVAGFSQLANNEPNNSYSEAFLWASNRLIHIPPYHNFYNSDAFGVNALGQVVGVTFVWTPGDRYWGFLWQDSNHNSSNDPGEMKLLGTLGGQYSDARAINEQGQVAGCSYRPDAIEHAFLITPEDGEWKMPDPDSNISPTNRLMRDLGALEAQTNRSVASAINQDGWVVGFSTVNAGFNRAFLWRNGVLTNLNHLIPADSGWTLTEATGINDHNEITGNGLYYGQPQAFLLHQEGAISTFLPVMQLDHVFLWTNEAHQVLTQEVLRVEALTMRWSSAWGSALSNYAFTVEGLNPQDPMPEWRVVEPSSQWPMTNQSWTCPPFSNTTLLFRVRAE